jgi:hypothetical protein
MAGDPRRFEALAQFIAERFPRPGTQTVLDVGGSMGILCYHLARLGYEVTVVDPRRRDVKRHYRKLARRGGFHMRMHYVQRVLLPEDDADLLVGLHPDEATEWVVRQAVRRGRAFVVVPCCVMPLDGVRRSVEEWHQYLCALAAGTHAVRVERLPISGANIVIWAPAPDKKFAPADKPYLGQGVFSHG